MTPFHVRMKVVCVPSAPIGFTKGWHYPVIGQVYPIREIIICVNGTLGLLLEGVVNAKCDYYGGREPSFRSYYFRPAHENRMDELRTLLAPSPSKAKTPEPVQP